MRNAPPHAVIGGIGGVSFSTATPCFQARHHPEVRLPIRCQSTS